MEHTVEERVAILEERTSLIPEMREDLKVVVAYVNQQQGKSTLLGLLWAALIGLGGIFVGKGHWFGH